MWVVYYLAELLTLCPLPVHDILTHEVSCPSAMSQFRALAGVLRGGCFGGTQWLRQCGGKPARRRWFDLQRSCSSGAAPDQTVSSSSSSYVEEMYFAWLEDHKNVHEVTMSNLSDQIYT